MKEGKITLSQKQLKTFKIINSFIDKSITRQQAAELLGLSTRQITRLKKGVLTSGAQSLIHKNTGRKPAHAVSDETKEAVLKIFSRPEFSGVNFLHFKDRAVSETQYSPYFRPFFLFFFSVVLHISENIFTKFSNNY